MWGQLAAAPLPLPLLLLLLLRGYATMQLQSCIDGFVVHKDKIIRTEDSLKLGAVYLSEYEVSSKVECIKWCCETDTCDVFVFEERKAGGCYLFHCGPPHDFKCKFTNHLNYSSAVLANYNLLQSADAIDELKSLRKSDPAANHVPATSTSTTTTTTSTTTATTTTPSPPTSSSEAVKLSCSRNQFECRSSDDCIAIYNVCDGIPQCADGSDEALELGCPQERTTLPPPPPPQVQHVHPHQHQAQPPILPDLAGYQQMMQHQQYPMRLYPPEGAPVPNQETANGWPNYQPRGYVAPPQQQQQQQQQQPQQQPPNEPGMPNEAQPRRLQPPVNYNQWQQQQQAAAANGPWGVSLDEQKLAMAHANHANAFQPPASNNYPPQQQMPHIFNDKPAGVRLEELESANGLYGRDPNRSYAPYYPAVIRHPESSWQETSNNDNLAPSREAQQQLNVARMPLATVAPPRENVPYQEPKVEQQLRTTTSTTPPPCDSAENRQADAHDQPQLQHPKSSDPATSKASAEHSTGHPAERKAHELELKTVAQAHLQEHKSITIVDQLARSRVSPRVDELELSRPKGAVISLALGLSVTAIMAVLIACRLRVVKRRGRGRSHDSYAHDTDYLVNGMYL